MMSWNQPFREFSSLRLCAFAGNLNMFLGVESVWPETNVSRKGAKIAKKKHGKACGHASAGIRPLGQSLA
jgi:hypothetical protein